MGLFDIFRISQIKGENEQLKLANVNLVAQMQALGVNEYYQTKQKISQMEQAADQTLQQTNSQIASNNALLANLRQQISELQERNDKLSKSVASQERKLS